MAAKKDPNVREVPPALAKSLDAKNKARIDAELAKETTVYEFSLEALKVMSKLGLELHRWAPKQDGAGWVFVRVDGAPSEGGGA